MQFSRYTFAQTRKGQTTKIIYNFDILIFSTFEAWILYSYQTTYYDTILQGNYITKVTILRLQNQSIDSVH